MNKKKILTLLVTTSLLAVVGVGSTLAYFTDKTETLTNVVTMGRVEGRLVENGAERTKDGWSFTDEVIASEKDKLIDYINVMPGDNVKKNPTVHLTPGSADAWVRVSFKVVGDGRWMDTRKDMFGKTYKQIIEENIVSNMGSNWRYNLREKSYYYKEKLTAPENLTGNYLASLEEGKTKATLFDHFTFPIELDNRAASQKFRIEVYAELIQADYVGLNWGFSGPYWYSNSEGNNMPWPPLSVDIQNYTAPSETQPSSLSAE